MFQLYYQCFRNRKRTFERRAVVAFIACLMFSTIFCQSAHAGNSYRFRVPGISVSGVRIPGMRLRIGSPSRRRVVRRPVQKPVQQQSNSSNGDSDLDFGAAVNELSKVPFKHQSLDSAQEAMLNSLNGGRRPQPSVANRIPAPQNSYPVVNTQPVVQQVAYRPAPMYQPGYAMPQQPMQSMPVMQQQMPMVQHMVPQQMPVMQQRMPVQQQMPMMQQPVYQNDAFGQRGMVPQYGLKQVNMQPVMMPQQPILPAQMAYPGHGPY